MQNTSRSECMAEKRRLDNERKGPGLLCRTGMFVWFLEKIALINNNKAGIKYARITG